MILRTLFRAGGSLLAMLVILAICAWFIYSQRLQLEMENRKEMAHAAHELGAILGALTETADKFFKDYKSTDGQPETKAEALLPVLMARAESLQLRNPYLADYPAPKREPPTCAGGEAGLLNPNLLVVPVVYPERRDLHLPVSPEAIFDDVAISRAFEYLFIADESGKVTFEVAHGSSGQRRVDRSWLDRRAEGDSGAQGHTIRLEDIAALQTASGSKLAIDELKGSSGTRSIRLGDETYQLYSYPFEIRSFSNKDYEDRDCAPKVTWIVGGLVDPQQMWIEALTISHEWMLLLFVTLVVAVIGQPFVKLFLLSPTERFRFADACLLVPSAAVLLVLATILLLDAGTFGQLQVQAATGLKRLADGVEHNLTADVRQMLDQLDEYDRHLSEHLAEECANTDVTKILETRGKDRGPAYRDFVQVFWTDPGGTQFLKRSVHGVSTGFQKVDQRAYFTEARNDRLWREKGTVRKPFFVQSLRTFTTGELLTAVSIRSALPSTCAASAPKEQKDKASGLRDQPKDPEVIVAAMTGSPLSVERPFLPAGLSFAVIESSGRVIYHSDRRRSLKENLYDELGDPARLEAAIHAGQPQRFSTTYARRPTEVYVKPYEALPATWFVIAFRDEQWLETVNSEVLFKTIAWSLAALMPTMLLPLVLLVAGKDRLAHFWPDPNKARYYSVMARAFGVMLVLGLAGVALLEGRWLFAIAIAFPTVVLGIMFLVYAALKSRNETDDAAATDRARQLYFVALACCWASVAIVPATGLFRHCWKLELAKLGHLETQRADEYRASWIAQDRDLTQSIAVLNNDRAEFLENRQRYLGAYQQVLPRPVQPLAADARLDEWLPLYNETAARLRHQRPEVGNGSSTSQFLQADLAFTWLTALGTVLTALLAWSWLRYKERHLFWSHLIGRQPQKIAEIVKLRRFVAFLAPSQRERLTVVNLVTAATVAAPDTNVFVDDFERMLVTAPRRLETLERLEKSVATTDSRAVIFCRTEPVQFLNGEKDLGTDILSLLPDDLRSIEKERWLRVLEPFVTHVTQVSRSDPRDAAVADARADSYFHSLWRYCSIPEKLTLIHVAEEGFANPHLNTVERLVDKGLLVFDPNLKLMSKEFERFVLEKAASAPVKTWERSNGGFGWARARWIFILLILGGLVLLASTQGAWFKGAAAMLTGVAAALETISQLLRAAQQSRSALAD